VRVAAELGRVAGPYESAAGVRIEVVKRVAALARREIDAGQVWIDLGSGGGGMLLENLRDVSTKARFVCLDSAFPPLRRAVYSRRTAFAVNADIGKLPLRDGTLNGATMVSVLQWLASPEDALLGIAKALKPAGTLCFSVYVDGAFMELVATRGRMGLPEVIWLPTVSEFLMALDRAGFDVRADGIEYHNHVQRFSDAVSALGSLNRLGSTAADGRLLNRLELAQLYKDYTLNFGNKGTVPLTYRSVIGVVKKRN
jgi:SAM-dependent methyltransferase